MTAARDAGLTDALRDLGAQALRYGPVSGGAAAVTLPDGTRLSHRFGTAGPRGDRAVGPEDRFEIGSVSKTIAALVTSVLVGEGALGLDDDVQGWLPWLRLPAGGSPVTVAHLLTHTTGWISGNDAVPGELAQALTLGDTAAGSAPGERFHYSNLGYVVLGLVLARAGGASLAALTERTVTAPLGMTGALAAVAGAERPRLCPGTVPLRDDVPWQPGEPLAEATWLEPAGADGHVACTIGDFAILAETLASPELAAARLGVGVRERLWSRLAPGGEGILDRGRRIAIVGDRYGLGVNVEPAPHGRVLSHGGGMVGYGAFLLADEAAGIGVAVQLSAPGEQPVAELFARDLHARALGVLGSGAGPSPAEPVGETTPASWCPAETRPAGEEPRDEELRAIVGSYRSYSPWFPVFRVLVVAGQPVLRAPGGVEAPGEDTPLVRLPDGGYRIGAELWLPERIRFGPIIDGRAAGADRDGCRYARVADPRP